MTDLGIDKSIFIKPKTFHLTVLMLKLWNKDRVNAAAEVLQVKLYQSHCIWVKAILLVDEMCPSLSRVSPQK